MTCSFCCSNSTVNSLGCAKWDNCLYIFTLILLFNRLFLTRVWQSYETFKTLFFVWGSFSPYRAFWQLFFFGGGGGGGGLFGLPPHMKISGGAHNSYVFNETLRGVSNQPIRIVMILILHTAGPLSTDHHHITTQDAICSKKSKYILIHVMLMKIAIIIMVWYGNKLFNITEIHNASWSIFYTILN